MSLVITTPTGHVGSHTVRLLLDAGRDDLVLLVRDAQKLPADVRDRTETREGALQDAAFVREATAGADALLWISPADVTTPDLYGWYETLGAAAAGAVHANGIGHVVHVSSDGAQKRSGHGPVSGVGRIEDALDLTEAAVRHLRPTFFMENFEHQLGAIVGAGAVFFPQPPDTSTGMIATRDIAAAAADLLLDHSWSGQEVVTLHGARTYTYTEAAAILAAGLGRDVRMQQVPPEAIVQQYTGMGATPAWAQGFVDLYTSIGLPGYADTPRTAATSTPTTLETYVADTLRPMLDAVPARRQPAPEYSERPRGRALGRSTLPKQRDGERDRRAVRKRSTRAAKIRPARSSAILRAVFPCRCDAPARRPPVSARRRLRHAAFRRDARAPRCRGSRRRGSRRRGSRRHGPC